jgi:hypothetical protein
LSGVEADKCHRRQVLSQVGRWANFYAAFKLTGGALDSTTAIHDLVDHKGGQPGLFILERFSGVRLNG